MLLLIYSIEGSSNELKEALEGTANEIILNIINGANFIDDLAYI